MIRKGSSYIYIYIHIELYSYIYIGYGIALLSPFLSAPGVPILLVASVGGMKPLGV